MESESSEEEMEDQDDVEDDLHYEMMEDAGYVILTNLMCTLFGQ
jgi:hypothetical protein